MDLVVIKKISSNLIIRQLITYGGALCAGVSKLLFEGSVKQWYVKNNNSCFKFDIMNKYIITFNNYL